MDNLFLMPSAGINQITSTAIGNGHLMLAKNGGGGGSVPCVHNGGCCGGSFPYQAQLPNGGFACSQYSDCHQTTVCAKVGFCGSEIESCLNGVTPTTGFTCSGSACPAPSAVAPSTPTGMILLAIVASAVVGAALRFWKKASN